MGPRKARQPDRACGTGAEDRELGQAPCHLIEPDLVGAGQDAEKDDVGLEQEEVVDRRHQHDEGDAEPGPIEPPGPPAQAAPA